MKSKSLAKKKLPGNVVYRKLSEEAGDFARNIFYLSGRLSRIIYNDKLSITSEIVEVKLTDTGGTQF